MQQAGSDVAYGEIHGLLERGEPQPPGLDLVVLSNIERGAETSAGAEGLVLRYVARGCENYRIAGRSYRLEAGRMMITPHDGGAECEVRNVDRAGTLGLCTLIRGVPEDFGWAFGPMVMSGHGSLGMLMRDSVRALSTAPRGKPALASRLIAGLRSGLPNVSEAILAQAGAVYAAKPATRVEMVRRANLAQAYLHAVVDRAVDLRELAAAVCVSPFRLLTAFQQCFGETPASYHRKLRLTLALQEAQSRHAPISVVSDQFGFAGASSFSHAYRRAFGRAPVWSKPPR